MHALVILERASKGPLLAGEKGDVGEQGFPAQLRSLMSFVEAHLLTRQGEEAIHKEGMPASTGTQSSNVTDRLSPLVTVTE